MVQEEFKFKRNCWRWLETYYPGTLEIISQGKAPEYPVHVEIHPHHSSTVMCNNNCPACTGRLYRQGNNACEFGIEPARLLETIKGFRGKVRDVIFSGNSIEPLLYPEIVSAINVVHEVDAMFSLYSNFYYANRSGVFGALTSPTTSLDYIRISLNAGKKESYELSHRPVDKNAFDIVLENIQELLRLKRDKGIDLYVHLTYLLDRYNSSPGELEGIVKWAAENKGINGLRFSVYQKPIGLKVSDSIDFSREYFKHLRDYVLDLGKVFDREDFVLEHPWEMTQKEEKKKTFSECLVGKVFPVIGMDGGVYPCTAMASPFSSNAYRYGNINKEDFWDIWSVLKEFKAIPTSGCYDCTRAEFDINARFEGLRSS